MIRKAELTRKAQISPFTVSRIEKGLPCHMETKRKIIPALGLEVSDKDRVFFESDQGVAKGYCNMRPLENANFCLSSRKTKILTAGNVLKPQAQPEALYIEYFEDSAKASLRAKI